MKKLIVFKKLSKKCKPYFEVCEVEGNQFTKIGFAQLVDKTIGK